MNVTVDLPTDVVDRLSRRAAQQGQDIQGLMRGLAEREAGVWDAPALADWDRLLDSFTEGDAEDHQDTVATLTRALNGDRPGQRRVFGEGVNPSIGQPS